MNMVAIAGAAFPHLTIAGYEATIHEHQTPLEVKITYRTHIVEPRYFWIMQNSFAF